jgi:hypothetical protein
MQTRMNKYYNTNQNSGEAPSRTKKYEQSYHRVSNLETLDDFDIRNNESIIGDNSAVINIDEINELLKKRSNRDDEKKILDSKEELPQVKLDETREYDINSVLKKAMDSKESNYIEDKYAKLNNTEFDILNKLNIKKEEKEETDVIPPKEELNTNDDIVNLMNTISLNEQEIAKAREKEELDPLNDLFSDLKGDDDNTKVMGTLTKDLEIAEAQEQTKETTKPIEEAIEKIKQDKEKAEEAEEALAEKNINKAEKMLSETNEFTGSQTFTKSDFDDFNDLKEDMRVTKILIKILIVILVVAALIGLFIFVDKFLNLGLLDLFK